MRVKTDSMERMSDVSYIEKVLNGETDCFARLLERYSKQVFSLIVKIVGNREDAEELTQDVFVKAYGSLSQFRRESSLPTWLYRIAYNMAISATRKKKMDSLPIDELLLSETPDEPGETDFGDSDAEMRIFYLNRALELLSPDERALIMFFYKENQSMEEIALITGLTVTNVKTKICRIRKKLYVYIRKMEEEQDGKEK